MSHLEHESPSIMSTVKRKTKHFYLIIYCLQYLNRVINPTRFSLYRQLQQVSAAPKSSSTSLQVGQELHGYIVKEVNRKKSIH